MSTASRPRRRFVLPWQDRRGRLVPLKAAAFVLLLLPGLELARRIGLRELGAEPYGAAIHFLGLWTIRLLVLTLAVTPLQRLLAWPRLALLRRMLGVATAVYAGLHLGAYCVDQSLDGLKIALELVRRFYLAIGLAALLGLVALAATSTDGAVRRLGAAWTRLHRLVYPVALLAMVHFFLQSKLDTAEPTWMAGLLGWLLLDRLLPRAGWTPALLTTAAAGATALGEALYFHLKLGAPLGAVLGANLSLATGLRPAAVVLLGGGALSLLAALRRLRWRPPLPPGEGRARPFRARAG
jgi:sulfoxide reductase heme-binding subunit YedZ